MPITYRARLRTEGWALAACGALASVALVALVDAARENVASTVGQLVVVAVLLAVLGPRAVRSWAGRAEPVAPEAAGTGEPTPLWHLPLVMAVLALLVGLPTGAYDASLRVTSGCVLVGLAQAVLLERTARAEEQRLGGTLVRLPGSRLVLGTKLGVLR